MFSAGFNILLANNMGEKSIENEPLTKGLYKSADNNRSRKSNHERTSEHYAGTSNHLEISRFMAYLSQRKKRQISSLEARVELLCYFGALSELSPALRKRFYR